MTKQRKLILDIINRSYSHPTAEEIYKEAKEIMPSIALGTVYRNLGIMVEDGDIRRIVGEGAPDKFDRIAPDHEHLRCISCGKITDFQSDSLRSVINKAAGCEICGYDLVVKHVCAGCKKEQKQIK